MIEQKSTFSKLFLALVILLMVMPFITTVNEFLTRWVLQFGWYKNIERLIVPFEIKSVIAVLNMMGIKAIGSFTTLSIIKDGSWQKIWISWNCVGWQSAILLLFTLITGLQGKYTMLSKAETVLFGFLGTFFINIGRIVMIILIFKFIGYLPATIFHDYIANIAMIAWLFFFWWFAYSFVLEEGKMSN